ncbi:hypothetical protein SNE40_021293 [Patella caerulea]|uniref:Uncharacterized protein n=1 Tax=Patella caerulea TaxID=87958 RepID=A0AAN8FZ71_PATCE
MVRQLEVCPDTNQNNSSYKILYPYVPPSLDKVYYTSTSNLPLTSNHPQPTFHLHTSANDNMDTNLNQTSANDNLDTNLNKTSDNNNLDTDEQSSCQCSKEASRIIEISDSPKNYLLLETHYAEDPISVIDPENSSHYEACDLEMLLKHHQTKEYDVVKINQQTFDKESADDRILDYADLSRLGGLVGELASLQIMAGRPSIVYMDEVDRKQAWERGQMDYMGVDSFDNIKRKLDSKIVERSPSPVSSRQVINKSGEVGGIVNYLPTSDQVDDQNKISPISTLEYAQNIIDSAITSVFNDSKSTEIVDKSANETLLSDTPLSSLSSSDTQLTNITALQSDDVVLTSDISTKKAESDVDATFTLSDVESTFTLSSINITGDTSATLDTEDIISEKQTAKPLLSSTASKTIEPTPLSSPLVEKQDTSSPGKTQISASSSAQPGDDTSPSKPHKQSTIPQSVISKTADVEQAGTAPKAIFKYGSAKTAPLPSEAEKISSESKPLTGLGEITSAESKIKIDKTPTPKPKPADAKVPSVLPKTIKPEQKVPSFAKDPIPDPKAPFVLPKTTKPEQLSSPFAKDSLADPKASSALPKSLKPEQKSSPFAKVPIPDPKAPSVLPKTIKPEQKPSPFAKGPIPDPKASSVFPKTIKPEQKPSSLFGKTVTSEQKGNLSKDVKSVESPTTSNPSSVYGVGLKSAAPAVPLASKSLASNQADRPTVNPKKAFVPPPSKPSGVGQSSVLKRYNPK